MQKWSSNGRVRENVTQARDDQPHVPPAGVAQLPHALHVPLAQVDVADRTLCCRIHVRIGRLSWEIADAGQQVPIVLRPSPRASGLYQIVAGFRRVAALVALGRSEVLADIRVDLDDAQALRASITSNCAHASLSDLDRARLLLRLRALKSEVRGGGETIEQLLAIGPRQRRNIEALLTLPEVCQRALEDDDQRFTATHALVLRAAQRRGESVHFAEWIGRIRREELSVRGLQLALARAARRERQAEPPEPTLFNLVGTDLGRGRARLLAIAIDRGQLSASAADALAADATALLSLLRRDATDATQAQGSRGGQRHEDT